jgi:alanyl-tRNA synthetase
MSHLSAPEIRQHFLDFFRSKGHAVVPSAPIVVKDDPTLMFTNAGMNQFKDIFLGNKPPVHKRIADTQKCLRVSGKHNDLEEVGVDTYHHTMFEMLGNWSFGDYFKEEAIAWAWELLTDVLGIDKGRLYVTIFEGDAADGLERDTESFEIWKKFIAEDRILLGNKKDNFWEMGDTGPCGPCTEIHVDTRPDEMRKAVDGKALVNNDDPLVIEIWNNVFIQYNRKADGSLEPLPDKHVDTGMGFERLVRVLQGKTSNYDTDVFQPLIRKIEAMSGHTYGSEEKTDIAMRVMSDHIRAISFTIADGQLPSNTGAGYVIRRILRRAVRYQYNFLGLKDPSLFFLVDVLAAQTADVFPELESQKHFVKRVIAEEEANFLKTLESGLKRYAHLKEGLSAGSTLDGRMVFELYDTFGFPADLTRLMARENGLEIDEAGFNSAMTEQKNRSRSATALETGDWVTVNQGESVAFVGYEQLEAVGKVLKYRKVKQKSEDFIQVVLDRTPFYPEGGGQQGDKGILVIDGHEHEVVDTRKENDLIIHFLTSSPEDWGGAVLAKVDASNRRGAAKNHSATHLLHAALKQVLGSHVQQKGSFLNRDILRFDFAHFGKMSEEELLTVEKIVNDKIGEAIALDERREVPKEEALKMGAMALFGEKYGDRVRMIIFDPEWSVELCGGTHVKNTAEIGLLKIISESAIAAGVRRIEALTGEGAMAYFAQQEKTLKQISAVLKNPQEPLKAIHQLVEEQTRLKKELELYEQSHLNMLREGLKEKAVNVNGVKLLSAMLDGVSAEGMKKIAFDLRNEWSEGFVIILGAVVEGKALLNVAISNDLVNDKQMDAGKIVRELAKHIQGGGGGQPFFATAGGSKPEGLQAAIHAGAQLLNN